MQKKLYNYTWTNGSDFYICLSKQEKMHLKHFLNDE